MMWVSDPRLVGDERKEFSELIAKSDERVRAYVWKTPASYKYNEQG
jgi:hypothetical protein